MHTLDTKELAILANLRETGRETLTNMSKKTLIPVSTIFEKLRLYEHYIIKRHTCLLDFTQLGYNTRASILLRVARDDRDPMKKFLQTHKSINSFSKINNGYDFMIEAIFREVKDVEEFVEHLETAYKIEAKEIHYIIDDFKREDFLSHPDYIQLTGAIS